MFRKLLYRLGLGDNDAESKEPEDGEDDGFAPSRLDASVLEAHGMGTTAAERELESIEEKAEAIESNRPDDHER